MNGNLIIKKAAQLVTCSGFAAKKGSEMADLNIINDGAVVIKEGVIEAVGQSADIEKQLKQAATRSDLIGLAERPLLMTVMALLHTFRGCLRLS